MSLKSLSAIDKEGVCEAWFERTLSFYSDEYARFVAGNPDPFANPVGAILRKGLAELLDALLDEADAERCRSALEPVVRIKAVQDVPPSEALAFILLLKEVMRQAVRRAGDEDRLREAQSAFDARVDRAALLAFDLYAECKDKIYQLRVQELKRNTAGLLRHSVATRKAPARTVADPCGAADESGKGCSQ